ncbi:MAG: electron transfer flavoprotein subunit alpha/FixB family protein, partial [Flavobacteriales bacterium]
MSILIYSEQHQGKYAKSTLEAVSYGAQLASTLGTDAVVVTNGPLEGDGGLGHAGASKILVANVPSTSDARQMGNLVLAAAQHASATVIVFAHDISGKLIAPRVAARWDAGLVAGATGQPSADFTIQRNVFSGKAIAQVKVNSANKVITVLPNSGAVLATGQTAAVEAFQADIGAASVVSKGIKAENKDGEIPLPEAQIVVSGGRGMKGPEHWGPIEELAKVLGAATACSRPVADIGWRPHHEHVGQTGVAIRPNLYIAIGISGAIQHLAGVNGSKTIVVINSDKEAPFFKSADYGIVGDAFTIVPKLVEAVKKFKAN